MSEIDEAATPDERPKEPGGRFEWAARALLVVGSLVVALVLIEIVLRIVDFRHEPFKVTGSGGNKPLTLALTNESFVFDPWLLWKPRPSHGVFNDRGVRGTWPTADDERFRILVIGDSNTLGWINGSGTNWPGFLGERLPSERFLLINAASWGWSSFQGVRRMIDLEDLDPDLVIFGFGANDGHRRGISDQGFSERLDAFARWRWWRLADLALATFDLVDRYRSTQARVPFDAFDANFREAHRWASERGAEIVFTTRPFREASDDPENWSYYVADYNAIARRLADELGAGLIDHAAWSAGRFELFTDNSHYTELGHRAAARIAHRSLRARLPAHGDVESQVIDLTRHPDHHGFFLNQSYPRWTDGDALFEPLDMSPLPGDRLVIETYGWHPWRHEPDRLWVQVRANGRLLDTCVRWPKRLIYRLPDDIGTIDVLRVTSATFRARDHFDGADLRRLGLDIQRIGLVSATDAPCG